jgi:hypothetical protein
MIKIANDDGIYTHLKGFVIFFMSQLSTKINITNYSFPPFLLILGQAGHQGTARAHWRVRVGIYKCV